MKKRILALLMAVCMIVSLLPATVFAADEAAGPARFVLGSGALEVIVNEGDTKLFTVASSAVTEIESGTYQIKITYETGKNPTIYLNGCTFKTSVAAIIIGSADTGSAYNNVAVDIVVEGNTTFAHSADNRKVADISSYIKKPLTIRCNEGKTLTMTTKCAGGQGAIYSEGDILLQDANVSITNDWNNGRNHFITSNTGSITVSGGDLTIVDNQTNYQTGYGFLRAAADGNIVIQDNANVTITTAKQYSAFATGNVTIKDSDVSITGKGVVFASGKPTLEYTKGYDVEVDADLTDDATATFDETNFEEELAANYASYKIFKITAKVPGKAHFTFNKHTADTADDIEAEILENGATQYYKIESNTVVAGGSEEDYQIKLTFAENENPKIYLNNADMYCGGALGNFLVIGKNTASTDYHNVNVEIVVEANTKFNQSNNNQARSIGSYINGDLIFTGNAWLEINARTTGRAIETQGDLIVRNAKMVLYSDWSNDRASFLYAANGNVIIENSELEILSNTNTKTGNSLVYAKGKISISKSALKISLGRPCYAFEAVDGAITIADSNLIAINEGNGKAIFNKQPSITGENVDVLTKKASTEGGEASINYPMTAGRGVFVINTTPAEANIVDYVDANHASYKYINISTHKHSFSEATCEAPATCSCGATTGTALDHELQYAQSEGNAEQHTVFCVNCSYSELEDHTEGESCSKCGYVFHVHAYTVKGETVAPTCTEQGYTWYSCACGEGGQVKDDFVDPAHTEAVDAAVAPDCENTGLTEGKHCEVCGEVLVAQEVVDALGHKYESVVTDPTCTTAGYTTHTCSVCGDNSADSSVAPLGHTAGKVVIENEVEAKLNVQGSYDEVVYCTVCGFEMSRETKYTDALLGAASIGNTGYATFAEALTAAVDGNEITLHENVTASAIITIDKAITLNGNGKTLTSTAGRAINIDVAGNVEITNLTIVAKGERAINIINKPAVVTITDVTATAKNYAVMVATSAADAKVTINGSDLTGLTVVNVAAANAVVAIDNTNITNVDANANENYGAISTYKTATNAVITVNGGKIVVADDSVAASNGVADATITFNGTVGAEKVQNIVAYIGDAGFTSLEDAIEYAKAGQTVDLIRDVTASAIITIDKAITINGNGKTLTSSAARAINIDTTGAVEINGLTINAAERAVNIINQAATVTLNNVTATAKNNAAYIATSAGAVKLTINNSNLTGLAVVNVAGAGSEVEINNTKITNVDANKDEDYGAITVWTSAASATVAVNGGEIIVADDSNKAAIFPANATVTGVDDIIYMVALVGDAGFTTLAEAIEYAKAGATIELVRDVVADAIITITKSVTINGNGKTLTSSAARAINIDVAGNVEITNLTIVAKGERAINIINKPAVVTITDVTATAKNYAVMVATSAADAKVTINGSDLTGLTVVNVAAANAVVAINDTNITNVDANARENYGAISTYKTATNAVITVNGGKIVVADDSVAASNGVADATITFNGTVGAEKVQNVVAYIGDAGFTTLAEAIEDAKAGQTVDLIRDVTLTEYVKVSGKVTINLNGNDITAAIENTYGAIYVGVNGDLTIIGEGAITNTAGYAIGNYGILTIENGTISGADASIYNFYYNATTYGKATINGGAVEGEIWNCGELAVNDGEIAKIDNSGALVVNGGTVAAIYARDGSDAPDVAGAGTIAIADTSVVTTPADYKLVEAGEGIYKVVAKDYVAQVGDEKFETLQAAINAANGKTIKLLADITVEAMIKIEGVSFTLDLNGYVLTAAENVNFVIWVTMYDELTIIDSGENGGIVNNKAEGYAILNQGTLIVEAGTFTGDAALWNGYDTIDSVAYLNGGIFNGINEDALSVGNSGTLYVDGAVINGWLDTYGKFEITSGEVENLWVETPGTNMTVTAATPSTSINGGTVGLLKIEGIDLTKMPITKADSVVLDAHEGFCWKDETILGVHSYNAVVTDPTCTDDGYTTYTCAHCGDKYTGNVVDALGHTAGVAVEENKVGATCAAEGSYDEVVCCSVCGFEMSRTSKTIEKLPHTAGAAVEENKVDATCKAEGSYDEVTKCSVCGTEMSRTSKTIAKLPHSNATKTELIKAPTCDADGSHYEITYCSVCDDELDRKVVTDAATGDHVAGDPVQEYVVGATCTADGSYDEVVYCSVCGFEMSRVEKTIAKLPHTAGTAVEENKVGATCTAEGSYDEVVYCSVCGFEMSCTTKTINALGHTAGEAKRENYVAPTLNEEGSYDEVVYCSVCGEELSRTPVSVPVKTGAVAELTDADGNVTKYPTLAEAVGVANTMENGATIKLLKDHVGAGLVIKGNVTIDFDKFYYSVKVPAEGTDAAAVKIIEGATLTVKGNGTTGKLSAHYTYRADFDTLVENEGTLVVDSAILYGANLKKADSEYYTVKNVKDTAVVRLISGAVTNNPVKAVGTVTTTGDVAVVIPANCCWHENQLVEHNYIAVDTEATCTTGGYTTHTCEYCKDSYIDNEIAALGHDWEAATLDAPKSCKRCPATEGEPKTGAVAELTDADGNVTKYATLAEAVGVANTMENGATIKLLKDHVGAGLVIKGNVTIDFDKYYYAVKEPAEGTDAAAVKIIEGATLTVKGNGTTGKLSAHYTYRADFDTLVENEGTLVVDGGILYGANLKKADSEYYTIKNVKDTAVAKILSGAVTNNPVNVVGTITKNAGVQVVAPEGYGWQNDTDLHGCNHSIETVVGATTETNGYVLHECVCGESYKDGYFTWSKGVAVVDGYYFRTLQDAINYAAGSNAEITLLKDSVGAGLEIEGDVTINFADYYYSASAPVEGTNAAMKIAQDATVTLTGNGEGKLSAHYTYRADFNTLIVNEGTLVVDGAMLYGKNLDKADECYIVTGNTAEFLSGTVVVNNSGTTYGNPEEAA